MTDLERFYTHVTIDPSTGCHVWDSARNPKGYGQFSVRRTAEERNRRPRGGNKRVQAHKWIFEYHNGPVQAGYEVDHKCCNPACVNYEQHLQPLTKAKNLELRGVIHL